MFGVHGHAKSVLTLAKIRKHFQKTDTKAVAREVLQISNLKCSLTEFSFLYSLWFILTLCKAISILFKYSRQISVQESHINNLMSPFI